MEGITIREMSNKDLAEVHDIEKRCFTTPWQVSSFDYEISNKDAILKVAIVNNQLIGYVCIRSILDVTHVLDLAVTPEFRKMGFGSLLLMNALYELRRLKPETTSITLEVRESNIAAIRLYEKFGFREIGRRRGYYQKPHEDAVIMEHDITSNDSKPTFH